jgi:hypothetical protein
MSSGRTTKPSSSTDGVPQQPQTSPPNVPTADYTPFIWQQLNDIQAKLAAVQTSVEHLNQSSQSTKTKVEALDGLKNQLIGGFVALGFVFTLASGVVAWSASKIWDTVSAIAAPAMKQAISTSQQQPTNAPIAPPAPAAPAVAASIPVHK